MSDDSLPADRCACPWCGEDVRRAAKVCPHCNRPPLWVVTVTHGVDPRTSYRIARSIETAVDVEFLELKRRLDEAPGVILSDLVRESADSVSAVLSDHGVGSELTPIDAGLPPVKPRRPMVGSLGRPATLAAVAVAAIVVVVLLLSKSNTGRTALSKPLRPDEIGPRMEASAARLQCSSNLGTGFFVEPDLLLTNEHVLCGDEQIDVATVDGGTYTGRVVYRDRRHDLALVRVPNADADPLPLGDASALRRGDAVYTIGNPLGLDFTLSQAIVSHPERVILGVSCVQIDGSIHPGNSGGALVDDMGRAVAVVSMRFGDQSDLGFAVPVNYLFGASDAFDRSKPWFDSSAWEARVDEARSSELAELENIRAEAGRPMLAVAAYQPPGAVFALVGMTSEATPFDQTFTFRIVQGESVLCRPSGTVTNWQRSNPGREEVQDRLVEWLESHDIDTQVWFAPVQLEMTGCPGPSEVVGATLELDGAAKSRNQVRIQPKGW